MIRMIERWFPCAEVSAGSAGGWGSGNQEKNLFPWFAARPTAQAKAAVICSLLPWPDDQIEQARLQTLVREAMTGRYAAWGQLRATIIATNPGGVSVLDPFSGRGMIPLEAARLGLPSYANDYSPIAALASELLTDYPFRNWDDEPQLSFENAPTQLIENEPRLLRDVRAVLHEVGRRFTASMAAFYPIVGGKRPWGYLWAATLPCQECGRRFPLVGSYELRKPSIRVGKKNRAELADPGQSYYIDVDATSDGFSALVHDGPPRRVPTLSNAVGPDGKKIAGKSAVCPFCTHPHSTAIQRRLSVEGQGRDVLLAVADDDADLGKVFRLPTQEEIRATADASEALAREADFAPGLPAIPNEEVPDNDRRFIQPIQYGARCYGDFMCERQTLSTVRLARILNNVSADLRGAGTSNDYVRALAGYAAAQMVRKIKRSTRGTSLDVSRLGTNHIYVNDSAIAFSYDFFEVGIGDGPGSWESLCRSGLSTLRSLLQRVDGTPTTVMLGTAASLPFRSTSIDAVVTDPPYDALIYYTDASDILYVWLKRALAATHPEIAITADPRGLQDKSDEMIVKDFGAGPDEHRTKEHYDSRIQAAFAEARRVVRTDGVVTIVFGHGEVEVWQRLLSAISGGGLVLTGSWPANTEAGSNSGGKANIRTTLTMACRSALTDRQPGRKGSVESAIKAEIKARYPEWERWGLAPTDMLMAAAGPAMEIVGRYSEVLDAKGEAVEISTFLPLARAAVQEAMAVEIDHHPLETFDSRTRFALWWVRLFGREVAAKSELRWQVLAASLEIADVRDLIPDAGNGCRFVCSAEFRTLVNQESAVIDVALALAAVSDQGREAMGDVLAASGRQPDDAYLWATVKWLADRLSTSDPDSVAFNRVVRAKDTVSKAALALGLAKEVESRQQLEKDKQGQLFS